MTKPAAKQYIDIDNTTAIAGVQRLESSAENTWSASSDHDMHK
jgi:hypothetical protein